MSETIISKAPYIKPRVMVLEIELNGLVCSSPPILYMLGGGGTYDEGSIWDNGEDY